MQNLIIFQKSFKYDSLEGGELVSPVIKVFCSHFGNGYQCSELEEEEEEKDCRRHCQGQTFTSPEITMLKYFPAPAPPPRHENWGLGLHVGSPDCRLAMQCLVQLFMT